MRAEGRRAPTHRLHGGRTAALRGVRPLYRPTWQRLSPLAWVGAVQPFRWCFLTSPHNQGPRSGSSYQNSTHPGKVKIKETRSRERSRDKSIGVLTAQMTGKGASTSTAGTRPDPVAGETAWLPGTAKPGSGDRICLTCGGIVPRYPRPGRDAVYFLGLT